MALAQGQDPDGELAGVLRPARHGGSSDHGRRRAPHGEAGIGADYPPEEQAEIAHKVGIAALKFTAASKRLRAAVGRKTPTCSTPGLARGSGRSP